MSEPRFAGVTLADVQALQRAVGVNPDGIYGPATHRAVMAKVAPAAPAAPPDGKRRVDARAIALLHHFESCKLTAYRCPAGVWTIGWGNTRYEDGSPVKPGDRISQQRADALFRNILATFEDGVSRAAPKATDHQFGAMVSLAYNIGLAAFGRSSVLRHHNAGAHDKAADAFLLWNKAGGKVLPGLVRRRNAERALYLGDFAAFNRTFGFEQ
jgi:GH24 family phage-related lysozyme (muramidase)